MITSIDIDEKLITAVMAKAGVKTKKAAILIALTEYLKLKKLQELGSLIGNNENFGLSLDDLRILRDER